MLPALAAIAIGLQTTNQSEAASHINEFLTNISKFGFAGTVCVYDHGKEIFSGAYGLANQATGMPHERDTVFDIGSLTKSFTATAVLQLQEKGKLRLEDTLDKYLPGAPDDKKAITIRELLSHTAGLDSDFPFSEKATGYYEQVSRDEALKRIFATTLIAKPGEMYSYSNLGYILLAAIIEQSSGTTYHDYIRQNIFRPAGMTSSGFWGDEMPRVPSRLIAHSYEDGKDTGSPDKLSATTWMDQGGGEMVSNAKDLYRFLQAFLDNRLVSKESRQLMWTKVKGRYGLGWFIDEVRGERRVEHAGDYIGFGTELEWFPDKQIAIIGLANTSNDGFGTRHIVGKILPQILMSHPPYEAFKGDRYTPPPKSSDVSNPLATRLIGEYNMGGGMFSITRNQGGLQISATGQSAINVLLDSDHDEAQHLNKLTKTTQDMITELAHGKSETLAHAMRRPDLLPGYRDGVSRSMKGWQQQLGSLQSIACTGTAPAGFPHGGYISHVEFKYANGTRGLNYCWMNDRILFAQGVEPSSPYTATLKQGAGRKLVGWNIITFRGFEINPTQNSTLLEIKGSQRSAVARRSVRKR
jgi:CubicO group peptidase (beta-lactamase class C family)